MTCAHSAKLAQRTLTASDNRAESFARYAAAYINRVIFSRPETATLDTVRETIDRIIAEGRDQGVREADLPAITDGAMDGVIRIEFCDGRSIVFYNPDLDTDMRPETWQEYSRSSETILQDLEVNSFLREQVLVQADAPGTRVTDPAETDASVPGAPADIPRFGKVHDRKLREKGYRYYMVQGGRKRYFHFRGNIFASLDDQITGNLDEREWLIAAVRDVKAVQAVFAEAKGMKTHIPAEKQAWIEARLKGILNIVGAGRVRSRDKQRAAGYVEAAIADYDRGTLEDIRESYRNLSRAIRALEERRQKVEDIFKGLRGILNQAMAWAREQNEYMASSAPSGDLSRLYALADRDEIKAPENEPDFEGVEPVIRRAIRLIRTAPAENSRRIREDLKAVEEDIKGANVVLGFLSEFINTYYNERYLSGTDQVDRQQVFEGIWHRYSARSGIVRGSPAYWYARFRQTAFIHRTIPDPAKASERISNPCFTASTVLIRIIRIGKIESILSARGLLPRDLFGNTRDFMEGVMSGAERDGTARLSVADLSAKEKRELVRALAADTGLGSKETGELEKCAAEFFTGADPAAGGETDAQPRGNAIESDKMEMASLMAVLPAPFVFVFVAFGVVTPATGMILFLYVAAMGVMPILTAYYIRDGLSFIHERKDHGLIGPFQKAENLRDIRDHEEEARGKVSYYSYTVEEKLRTGEHNGIRSALFANKPALRRIPKFFQWVIYFHESMHFRFRIKIEVPAVILTYSAPAAIIGAAVLLAFAWVLPSSDIAVLVAALAYNLLAPAAGRLVAERYGLRKSHAGHYCLSSGKRKHMTDREVDRAISAHVHGKRDPVTGEAVYWRDWLVGGDLRDSVELIRCPDRPDDIIVIRGGYSQARVVDRAAIRNAIRLSEKRSFVLIIADWGPESDMDLTARRKRVEMVARQARAAMRPFSKGKIKERKGSRFVKIDVRSSSHDVTRLREIKRLYRKRLINIKNGTVVKQAVASEVHGQVERLRNLLGWLRDKRHRVVVFMGDYLGKKNNGFEAVDVIREHITSELIPHPVLLMGKSEHMFIRAMLGDDNMTGVWPTLSILEGPAVMRSLKAMSAQTITHDMPVHRQYDIRRAKEFDRLVENIASIKGTSFDAEMRACYRLHPKLIDLMEFMVEHMRFVYHEDEDLNNIYLVGEVPQDLEYEGIKGIEALEAMEIDFREKARRGLRMLKIMKAMWMLMNPVEAEAQHDENREKALWLIEIERELNEDLGTELVSSALLDEMKRVISGEAARGDLDMIFGQLSARMAEVTRPLPGVFDKVIATSDSPFMVPGMDRRGGMEVAEDTVEARQKRRIELGVNTVITPHNFTRGFQDLGQVRVVGADGSVRLVSVAALTQGEEKSELILTAKTADETEVTGEGMSLESITRRKLKGMDGRAEGVEELVEYYDFLVRNVREKWWPHFLRVLKEAVRIMIFGPVERNDDNGRYDTDGRAEDAETPGPPAGEVAEREEAEEPETSLSPEETIIQNAGRTVKMLSHSLMSWRARVSSRTAPEEKIVLAINVGRGSDGDIQEMIDRYIVAPLKHMCGDGELEIILRNLHIMVDNGENLARRLDAITSRRDKDRPGLRKENIIIVTPESGLGEFEDFKEQSYITAFDDARLRKTGTERLNYYPIVEITLFAVMRMLGDSRPDDAGLRRRYHRQLLEWYSRIPYVRTEEIDEDALAAMCFDEQGNPKRTVILDLIPDAREFDPETLRDIYRAVAEFLTKA